MNYEHFSETVWDYYANHGRELPWRVPPFEAYQVLVSEVMLQQTQGRRVVQDGLICPENNYFVLSK